MALRLHINEIRYLSCWLVQLDALVVWLMTEKVSNITMISTNETHYYIPPSAGFGQRLKEYILKKHGTVNSFCRNVGIKYPAQMTPYLKGKCRPGKKILERLNKDGADIQWLMNGHSNEGLLAPLGDLMAVSCSRMDIDNLLRQIRLKVGRQADCYKPFIEAYAVIDHREYLVDLTGSIERFLGYELNALSEVALAFLIHPEDYVMVKSILIIERQDDDIVTFHSRFKTGEGNYMNVECCLYIRCKPMSDLSEYTMILRKSAL
ncbi:MAG: PAS domain-containing protein [Chlorobium sp.]